MFVVDSRYGEACVQETIAFVRNSLQAPATIFCWIEPDASFEVANVEGVDPAMLPEYFDGMHRNDPLNVFDIVERGARTALMETERARCPSDRNRVYADFLARHDVSDEVDFVFWQDGLPIAVLGALRRPGDPAFRQLDCQWEAMHRFLSFTLKQHPKVRRRHVEHVLITEYRLTPREIEAMRLLGIGASNGKIAALMGIGLATVKTHIISILDKLGVESRQSALAFASAL